MGVGEGRRVGKGRVRRAFCTRKKDWRKDKRRGIGSKKRLDIGSLRKGGKGVYFKLLVEWGREAELEVR